jgi:hypothetical protein
MNETCSCCEGVHKLTPVTTISRPGLNALSYRVGTHASFLETMKARLSNLELTAEDFDGATGFTKERLRPLLALTTRAASDPAIALLDAWALVGDVLTFYQERIANEGFLRIAVERRSVLELARLIDYRLRPGVAASVYLAYTLEKNTAVVIPESARSQSVPGPGELPQSFETADKLAARADWNTLPARLTRPQTPLGAKSLYFKGIATKLKLNDPLLICCGESRPTLLRVLTVEPDQAAGRTKVTVQDWYQDRLVHLVSQPTSVVESFASVSVADSVARLRGIIDRFRQAEDFNVNTSTQMAQRVIGHLDELEKQLESITTDAGLEALNKVLSSLREEHRLATEKNFTKLQPWIAGIVSELEQVSAGLSTTEPATRTADTTASTSAPAFAVQPSMSPSTGVSSSATSGVEPSLAGVSQLIADLEKPASQPPANSQRLGRSIAGNFSPASDALSRLLVAMRPSLRDSLYSAWENLPVTSSQPCCVYALRASAAVFGHNAPLKPIADVKTGRVVGAEEWTLFRSSVQSTERFVIGIKLNRTQNAISLGIQTIDTRIFIFGVERRTDTATLLGGGTALNVPFTSSPFNLPLTTPDGEVVVVTVSEKSSTVSPVVEVAVDLQFSNRNLSVKAVRTQVRALETSSTLWATTSTGSDPTSVFYSDIDPNSVGIFGDFESGAEPTEESRKISLDASYKEILPGSWVVLERPLNAGLPVLGPLIYAQVAAVREASRADYGLAAEGTQLELTAPWISPGSAPGNPPASDRFAIIRGTKVFAQSELLELAEEPIDPVAEPLCGNRIELANLVRGLEPGRSLIISGERTDITRALPPDQNQIRPAGYQDFGAVSSVEAAAGSPANNSEEKEVVPGVMSTELVMLAGVEQGYDPHLPGDKTHTTLLLSQPLAYCYKRETITIYGNVVKATHGETKNEVLGSGDGSQPMQQFELRQSPLTYLAAPTPAGAESTLQVRINDVLWHETGSIVDLGTKDHGYITRTDDKDQTTVVFGNGQYGARLPTGVENVKAVYRTGIGKAGNVKVQQISSPVTRPLGVKSVINPLPATGGADREDRDQARRNAPMALMALDRLISVQDYEDFARTYAGIAKASAARLSDGRRQVVQLTIAGSDDIPIATTSDLFVNLRQALHQFGDPYQSLRVAVRKLKLLFISAKVRLLPDYQWEFVEPKIRGALLDKFSFAQRELGQDALPSEALNVMQGVAGVAYVDLDTFDALDEDVSAAKLATLGTTLTLQPRVRVHKARIDKQATVPTILPAQLAYLSPSVADTLILTEKTG